jgi:hypothetical protein
MENIEFKIRLLADDCIMYKEIMDGGDFAKLQTHLNRLGEWAVENETKVNPDKEKQSALQKLR